MSRVLIHKELINVHWEHPNHHRWTCRSLYWHIGKVNWREVGGAVVYILIDEFNAFLNESTMNELDKIKKSLQFLIQWSKWNVKTSLGLGQIVHTIDPICYCNLTVKYRGNWLQSIDTISFTKCRSKVLI